MQTAWFERLAGLGWRMGVTSSLNRAARYLRVLPTLYARLQEYASASYQVLMYHRVNADADPFAVDAVDPHDFANQISFLKSHYYILPLRELCRRAQEKTLPPNALAITFDDGYTDNYQFALPILRRFAVPATLFLATQPAETGEPLWFDVVMHAFRQTRAVWLDVPPLTSNPLRLDSLTARVAAAEHCLAGLRAAADHERTRLQADLLRELRVHAPASHGGTMMSWSQLRQLDGHGFTVEGHTASHPILSRVPADAARREIESSKDLIEERLQKQVQLFAYPNGKAEDYTEETKRLVARAGYAYAFTTVPERNLHTSDRFALGRLTPWLNDLPRFALLQARLSSGL